VCDLVVEQAYTRYVLRVDPTLSRENLADPMDDASIELGPVYRSAGLLPEGGDDRAALENPRTPTGRVGVRAPHLPVEIDGAPGSVHDVLGRGFALVAGRRVAGRRRARLPGERLPRGPGRRPGRQGREVRPGLRPRPRRRGARAAGRRRRVAGSRGRRRSARGGGGGAAAAAVPSALRRRAAVYSWVAPPASTASGAGSAMPLPAIARRREARLRRLVIGEAGRFPELGRT
jgi:hypothetical protein